MKFLLLPILIYTNSLQLHASWDDAFKKANVGDSTSKSAKSSQQKIKSSQISSVTEDDFEEKIDYSTGNEWYSAFQKEFQKPKTKIPKELADILGKVAQIDALLPDSSPEKAMIFSQFAAVYLYAGDYVKAEQIALRSARMAEKITGKNSFESLTCLSTLGLIYDHIGDSERTLDISKACLKICAANPKANDAFRPTMLAMMALAQIKLGMLREADDVSNEALDLSRQQGINGKSGPLPLLRSLQARAGYLSVRGSHSEANDLYKEALLLAKKFNTQNGETDLLVNSIYQELLLRIFENHVAQGNSESAQIAFEEHEKIKIHEFKSLPKEFLNIKTIHTADEFASRAVLERLKGNDDEAKKYADKYISFHRTNLPAALLLVESQRLNWQKRNLNFSLPVAFCTPDELGDLVLQWKGIVLDSISKDRNRLFFSKDQKDRATFEKLLAIRRVLAQNLMQGVDPASEQMEELKKRIFLLERTVSKQAAAKEQTDSESPHSIAHLKAALPDNVALIEFLTYRELPDFRYGPESIGALLITKNSPTQFVSIGSLVNCENILQELKEAIKNPALGESHLADKLKIAGKEFFEKIAVKFPPQTDQILICPDGPINFVPFSSLMDSGGAFLAEKYRISYVGSSRDLLRLGAAPIEKKLVVYANPDFTLANENPTAAKINSMRSLHAAGFSKIELPPLPGTEMEARNLGDLAMQAGWAANLFVGKEATERKVTELRSPGILHLATHGFFLSDAPSEKNKPTERGMAVKSQIDSETPSGLVSYLSPMLKSGIALAGAQPTLQSWGTKKPAAPAENDGILTAEEVSALDLSGTWLVCLSACDTGVGEAKSGEGVFGLRRAFMISGARNLIMTLWPVDDSTTADLMADFYSRLFESQNPTRLLPETQRDWLVRLRNKSGLQAAVSKAGAFLIAGTDLHDATKLSEPFSTSLDLAK